MRSIACPNCKTKLAGSTDLLGVAVRCSACGTTFTATQSDSPYVEGLPPLPSNSRPLLLGGVVVLGLLIVTGIVVMSNQSVVPETDSTSGGGGRPAAAATPPRPEPRDPRKVLTTADGLPIEVPEVITADPVDLPAQRGSALERIRQDRERDAAAAAARAKPAVTSDDVTLSALKWEIDGGFRTLRLAYAFANKQSPLPGVYTLKVKVNGNEIPMPLPATLDAAGVLKLAEEKIPIGETRGPKVEAWVERTAAGLGVKVSNVASTE